MQTEPELRIIERRPAGLFRREFRQVLKKANRRAGVIRGLCTRFRTKQLERARAEAA